MIRLLVIKKNDWIRFLQVISRSRLITTFHKFADLDVGKIHGIQPHLADGLEEFVLYFCPRDPDGSVHVTRQRLRICSAISTL